MKTNLVILGAAVTAPFFVLACGEEAPPLIGVGMPGVGSADPMSMDGLMDGPAPTGSQVGVPVTPGSPASGTPTAPGAPAPITPGEVVPGTPAPITPGSPAPVGAPAGTVAPGDTAVATPGASTPAAETTDRPAPLMPPMPGATPAATTPASTPVTPVTPATPVTPTDPATPATPATATCDAAFSVGSSGFVNAPGAGGSCWQGYAWADATPAGMSTVTPASFETCGGSCMLCASGSVAATDDYSGVGLLGFNVNQQESSSTTGTLTPTGSITIDVSNAGGSSLRVQIKGSGGEWCKDITGQSGAMTIPLTDFQSECWEGGAMTPFSSGAIDSIMLLVPGSNTDATMFDICLNSVTPG